MRGQKKNFYKLIIWTSSLKRSVRIGIFFAITLPVFVLGSITYYRTKRDLHEYALSRRQAIAQFAAFAIHEKLENLKDVGTSLVTRVRFRQLISEGKWQDGIEIMSDVSKNFTTIDRIFLTDLEGNLKADLPYHPNLIGYNFKNRDWFQGVMKSKKAYVSDVYRRMAEPPTNVISIAIPILGKNNNFIGIMGLQLIAGKTLIGLNKIKIGPSESIYVVDKEGNIVVHPKYSATDITPNYSGLPFVKNALLGKSGVSINYNPIEKEESLTAYEPVPEYGWGVVAEQPTAVAFAIQASNLKGLFFINATTSLLTLFLGITILWIISLVKKTEDKLLKSQLFVDSVLENIPDMIVVKDIKDLSFIRINKAGEDLTGYSRNDLIGKNFYDLFSKTEADVLTKNELDIIFKKKRVDIQEEVLRTRENTERILHTKKIPIFDNRSNVEYLLAISEDITEKKLIEDTKKKLIREQEARVYAEHSIAIRDDFISIASHELRTPITALKLQLQLLLRHLKKDFSVDRFEKSLTSSLRSIEQLTQLVNVMLDITIIQSGHIDLKKEELSLADLVTSVCNRYSIQLQQVGCTPVFDMDSSVVGWWDKVRMEQIITNIIINAIKYAPGKPLKIKISAQKDVAILSIQDFGQGISEELKGKIFKRFERGVSHEHISGFGLGLFIAEKLIKAHGGRIYLKSEKGEGSIFTLELPIQMKNSTS